MTEIVAQMKYLPDTFTDLWDSRLMLRWIKDRFRRDLGNLIGRGYEEVLKRIRG